MPDKIIEEKDLASLGQMLKTKREVKGLTRRDMVIKIKIPMDQLEAIEEGRLSSLPPVFAKGFLRAYANELGLDAENILDEYRRITGGFKNEPASPEPLAPRYVEISVGGPAIPGLKYIIAILVLIFIIGGTFWLSPQFRSALFSMMPSLESLPNSETNTEVDTFLNLSSDENQQQMSNSANLSDNESNKISISINNEEPNSTFITPPVQRNGGTLTLSSKKDNVWVEVKVDDNSPEFITFKNGQTITWTAKEMLTVVSGNVPALNFNWDGVNIDVNIKDRRVNKLIFPKI